MKGDSRKEVVRTFAVEGVEITVRGSRYDVVKMMPPLEGTETEADPFESVEEMMEHCGESPNVEIIDRREINEEEKAAAWIESGWPEQQDTFTEQ